MRKKPHYYEDVRANACRRWQQLEADDELAGPWRQLFSQIQSPRHVISELLQNADDAGATSVRVSINAGLFTFQHDGQDFTGEEFRSLCRFGYSNKRNLHTIGFRGVGFKSTFSLGDPVEVFSPSLAVRFAKRRFTEPIWIEDAPPEELTLVRVQMRDSHRSDELGKNLEDWRSSPASLLFFNSLKRLHLDGDSLELAVIGNGPVENSWWKELRGSSKPARILLVRSGEESFPDDAIAEIRKERFSEELELPPCSVEIVLGLPHTERLFVVLPTGVFPDLPFSINGPFLQDPARTGIKDPSVSPTNRWLLDRVGRLAARTMLFWLKNGSLELEQRAAAYQLVPSPAKEGDTVAASVTRIVSLAFSDEVKDQPCVLTQSGRLVSVGTSFSPPNQIYSVWNSAQVTAILGSEEEPHLAYQLSGEIRTRLATRGWLTVLSPESVIERLSSGTLPPRPVPLSNLFVLWEFVQNSLKYDWNGEQRKRVAMVPVEGHGALRRANEIVRLSSSRKNLSEADWAFLAQYILSVDNDWLELISDTKTTIEAAARKKLMRQMLTDIGLGTMSIDTIVTRASESFFGRSEVLSDECIRFAHVIAALDARVPESFQYLTRDNVLRTPADGVVLDVDGQIEDVIPTEWADKHLLHPDYSLETDTCSSTRWREWASSEKSLLKPFVPIQEVIKELRDENDLAKFLERRQASCPNQKFYRYGYFQVTDYDFDRELVRVWKVDAQSSKSLWASVLKKVMAGGESAWDGKTSIAVENIQRNNGYTKTVFMAPVAAAWIARFQKTPCLPDTLGTIREPAELLLRSPETEPLMGVEPFVAAELDTPDTKPLLKLLGVRDTPAGPESILNRIRALGESENVPLHELGKWYDALDRILSRGRPNDINEAATAFSELRLVLTEQGEWVTSGEVFQSAGDLDIPDVPVIHSSFAQLSLWRRIGVADRPSEELILGWLKKLPTGRRLDGQELRRVRAFLVQNPTRIWNECEHWLNLDGYWIPTSELDTALRTDGTVRVRELFPQVKRRTADLRALRGDARTLSVFKGLRCLEGEIEYRLTDRQEHLPEPIKKPWMLAMGNCLRRLKLNDEERVRSLFEAATRLATTMWQPFHSLRITPYLDGTPIGPSYTPKVLWEGHRLYVQRGSPASLLDGVVNELSRYFAEERFREALISCFERSEEFVTEYLEQRFELEPVPICDADTLESLQEEPAMSGAVHSEQTADHSGGSDISATVSEANHDEMWDSSTHVDDPEDFSNPDDSEGEPKRKPREPRKPVEERPTLIARFAQQLGFRWSRERDAYLHSNGCMIQKTDELFPWVKVDRDGNRLARYWLKEQNLTSGVDLGADRWELLREAPDILKLVVLGDDGEPVVLSGADAIKMISAEKLQLFPLSYRLKRA